MNDLRQKPDLPPIEHHLLLHSLDLLQRCDLHPLHMVNIDLQHFGVEDLADEVLPQEVLQDAVERAAAGDYVGRWLGWGRAGQHRQAQAL